MLSLIKRKILPLPYLVSALSVLINASAHSDLSKLLELKNSLSSCQEAVLALQELIENTMANETITTLKTHNSTSSSTPTAHYPTGSTFISTITEIKDFEEPFSTTEMFRIDDAFEPTNSTGMEKFSTITKDIESTDSTTEVIKLTESTTEMNLNFDTYFDYLSTKESLRPANEDESMYYESEAFRIKRDAERTLKAFGKSYESQDEVGETWGISVMNVILSINIILLEISENPFKSGHVTTLDLNAKNLSGLTKSGKDDKALVLESNCESVLNASRETLSKLVTAKKVVKAELKRATSTKMGTTAVICLVSILLAFVIIALVCVLLKPWRRCCKKKETTSRRSSSSTTYSNYYRKTSALEGIRNFSYNESNDTEIPSAPTMSLSTMSIPSISIPRPTVIRLSDRYQPSSSIVRNCSPRELEPDSSF